MHNAVSRSCFYPDNADTITQLHNTCDTLCVHFKSKQREYRCRWWEIELPFAHSQNFCTDYLLSLLVRSFRPCLVEFNGWIQFLNNKNPVRLIADRIFDRCCVMVMDKLVAPTKLQTVGTMVTKNRINNKIYYNNNNSSSWAICKQSNSVECYDCEPLASRRDTDQLASKYWFAILCHC